MPAIKWKISCGSQLSFSIEGCILNRILVEDCDHAEAEKLKIKFNNNLNLLVELMK